MAKVANGNAADVNSAVQAAATCFKGAWRNTTGTHCSISQEKVLGHHATLDLPRRHRPSQDFAGHCQTYCRQQGEAGTDRVDGAILSCLDDLLSFQF